MLRFRFIVTVSNDMVSNEFYTNYCVESLTELESLTESQALYWEQYMIPLRKADATDAICPRVRFSVYVVAESGESFLLAEEDEPFSIGASEVLNLFSSMVDGSYFYREESEILKGEAFKI